MNVNRYVLGSIVVFVYLFVIEWFFHAVIMNRWYQENLSLLRSRVDAGGFAIWMILGFLVLAFGFCYVFVKGYENKGIGEGIRYGLYVAFAFSISTTLINYSVFPWPATWAIAWIIGNVIIMALAGAIFATIYRPQTVVAPAATA
jgi:hypothetical protein